MPLAVAFALAAPLALALQPAPGTARLLAAAALVVLLAWQGVRPSHDRDWSPDQALLPTAHIAGDIVTVRNVRNCRYRSVDDYDVAHYDATYDLRELVGLWYVLEPLSPSGRVAHTMLSFGFRDGRCLVVSVEIRKQRGERFAPLPGMFKQFELMYVLGDERDLIDLRANHRGHDVYLYPVRAGPAEVRRLLLDVLSAVNRLAESPEFYHTLTNTCTTRIVQHVRRIAPSAAPRWDLAIVLPGRSDRLAWRLGLIGDGQPLEALRQACRVNDRAAAFRGRDDFSQGIRGLAPP
jgi:hypothetical protein